MNGATLRDDRGFTLIELLVVLVILGVLVAVVVPVYLGFGGKAENRAAQADIRSAVSSAEAFYESNGTYSGMTAGDLRSYDAGLSSDVQVADGASKPTASSYCLTASVEGTTWSLEGPGQKGWYTTADCTRPQVSP